MSDTIQTKRCSKCKQIKPISEFHKDRSCKNGYRSYCKTCRLEYQRTDKAKKSTSKANAKWLLKNPQYQQKYQQEYARKYRQTQNGKLCLARGQLRFLLKNPFYYSAVRAIRLAVQINKLPRPDTLVCYHCGLQAKQYHHYKGYEPEHWFDVIPVCIKCHRSAS